MDHTPDQHAPHSHGHAHDHSHDHHHGGSDYYLQQLLTIFICGAFGVAGVLMYTWKHTIPVEDGQTVEKTKLGFLLADPFHVWVLGGSLLLLAVTVIRGVALWRSAGAAHHHHGHAHDHHHGHHEHKPGEACDHPSHAHDHSHHGHDHADHSADDHSHGNIYWRVVVLLLPIIILVMGLPNGTFSDKYLLDRVKGSEVGALADVSGTGVAFQGNFEDLAKAAYSEKSRDAFTGQSIVIGGKLKRLSNEKQFTLFFYKMTCCTADQVPLKATAILDAKSASKNPLLMVKVNKSGEPEVDQMGNKVPLYRDGQEVEVRGTLQFAQDTSGEWVTVIRVTDGGLKKVGK